MKFYVMLSLLIFTLLIRFYFFYSNQPQYTDGQQISFETKILSQPQIIGSRQVFTANHENQKIRIITVRFPELNYGENVLISGPVKTFWAQESNQIGQVIMMYFPKIESIKSDPNLLDKSLKVVDGLRKKLISLFSTTLPSPSSSLLMGIIFGIKEQMPKDFAERLRITGVFHVIAASGMNVTLVGGFISVYLAFFLKRQIAVLLSILGIVFYAVLTGLEASIIRAGIMGILVFSAQIMGRQTMAVNGIFLAGFVMLFIDPSLIFDIGFQLSFTATLGILFIKPIFDKNKKIKLVAEKSVIGADVLTTIAAQIATIPILLANFGTYSIYSVLVNGLVLWTVPILMAIGGIGAIVGLIFIPLGQLIIYLSYPLLIYFEKIVEIFGQVGGVIAIQVLSWQFVAGYYSLLSSILLIFRGKK